MAKVVEPVQAMMASSPMQFQPRPDKDSRDGERMTPWRLETKNDIREINITGSKVSCLFRISREYVDGHASPDPARPVDWHGVQRVVDLALEEDPGREEEERSTEGTHDHCAPQVVHVATGAEGNGT